MVSGVSKRTLNNTCNLNYNNASNTQPSANIPNESLNEDSSIKQLLFNSSNQQVF
jgi:hypothetical protein